jgi:F-type H+-transporting ATPase subunit gamma
MPGGQERILRRRIRSVQSTKKITRAFELIAASQIVRAQGRISGSRPYVEGIARVLAVTASEAGGAGAGRLIGEARDARNVLVVVIVGDRGLSGGYNSFALRAADRLMRDGERDGRNYRLVAVGRKAQGYFRFRGRAVEQLFLGMTDRPRFADARQVAAEVVRPFLTGEVDLVQVVSWRFRSAGLQTIEVRQLLPLPPEAARPRRADPGAAGAGGSGAGQPGAGPVGAGQPGPARADADLGGPGVPGAAQADPGGMLRLGASYEFEPDPAELLGLLVPQYAEAELFRALLEASASEHTARQRAMAAATENAEELITTYRRAMNRARQEAITTEIMEIVGGAEAQRQLRRRPRATELDIPEIANEEQSA